MFLIGLIETVIFEGFTSELLENVLVIGNSQSKDPETEVFPEYWMEKEPSIGGKECVRNKARKLSKKKWEDQIIWGDKQVIASLIRKG